MKAQGFRRARSGTYGQRNGVRLKPLQSEGVPMTPATMTNMKGPTTNVKNYTMRLNSV